MVSNTEKTMSIAESTSPLSLIDRVVSHLAHKWDLETGIDNALHEIASFFKVDTAVVYQFTLENTLRLIASTGLGIDVITGLTDQLVQSPSSMIYKAIDGKKSFQSSDTSLLVEQCPQDPYAKFLSHRQIKHIFLSPLTLKGDKTVGLLLLHQTAVYANLADYGELIKILSDQMALAIDRSNLRHEKQEAIYQAQALSEIGTILGRSLDLDHILDQVLQQIARVVPFETATIALVQQGKTQVVRAHGYEKHGEEVERLAWALSFNIEETSSLKQIFASGEPHIIPDVRADDGWINYGRFSYIRSWIGAPIIINHEIVAFLFLEQHEANFYQQSHATNLKSFCAQLSLSLQNARLFDEKKNNANTLHALNELMRKISRGHTAREVCMTTAESVLQILVHLNSVVLLYNDRKDSLQVYGFSGVESQAWPLGEIIENPYATQAIQSSKVVIVDDYWADAKQEDQRLARSGCFVPIQVDLTQTGVILMECVYPQAFKQTEISVLMTIADQLGQVLEKTRLIEEMQLDTAEIEALYLMSASVRDVQTIEEISHNLAMQCCRITQASGCGVFIQANDHDSHFAIAAIYPLQESLIGTVIPVANNVIYHVAQSKQMYIVDHLDSGLFTFQLTADESSSIQAKSNITIPLKNKDYLVGILSLWYAHDHQFEQREIRFINTVADIATNALERGLLLSTLEQRIFNRTKELETANERLKELDRLKSKFITDMTHELHTPVTNINLYLDLLKTATPDKRQKYIQVLRRELRRLESLSRDLKSISDEPDNNMTESVIAIDFNELIHTVVEQNQSLLHEKNLTLTLDLDTDIPPLVVSPSDMRNAVYRILQNAIEYNKAEGHIEIQTKTHVQSKKVVFQVIDTGIGIAENDLPHIFERFYRSAETTNIAGWGLGLAIVKEIVTRHGGAIQMESELGEGTVVWIELPYL